jgi:hypothetical protein
LHHAVQVRNRRLGIALRMHLARAVFAIAALRGHAEFELDVVKTPARLGAAGNVAVGDSVADANNHATIINENRYYLQKIPLNAIFLSQINPWPA